MTNAKFSNNREKNNKKGYRFLLSLNEEQKKQEPKTDSDLPF